jgi:magnesium transporter
VIALARQSVRKKRVSKAGLPPGTLVYTGEKQLERVRLSVIDYDEGRFQELVPKTVEECFPFKETPTVTWLNVTGLHDIEVIEKLGKHFDLHPLVLEDVLSTGQRPKYEDFGTYVFLVLKTLHYNDETHELRVEQISLVLGPNFVISFQEIEADPFDQIRERIRSAKGRIRGRGADYLAYALTDAIVDNYFAILEKIGDHTEGLGVRAVEDPNPAVLHSIQTLKGELGYLRRFVWPLREVISALERGESELICGETGVYFRDVYDHTIQVMETIESFRDLAAGMFDTYLSSVSNRMNEVMKVLTIIATIFIPVTFIAGVYGMNFRFMPELGWRWGYLGALLVMLGTAIAMLAYFRKKKWI